MEDLKVTIIQTALSWEKKEENILKFSEKIASISEKTDLIVLPEMFNTGFSMKSCELGETMDGPGVQYLKKWARESGAVVTGSLIIEENGNYFNRLVWMRPDGSYETYDKRHLFRMANEQEHFSAGSNKLIVELNGWKICPLICYDLRFPVWSRNKNEYDCLIYVANWPERRNYPWKTLLQARAIENLSYVIGVNRIGEDGNGINHSGDSEVNDFRGLPISKTNPQEESVETIALSYKELKEFREIFPAWMDADDFKII